MTQKPMLRPSSGVACFPFFLLRHRDLVPFQRPGHLLASTSIQIAPSPAVELLGRRIEQEVKWMLPSGTGGGLTADRCLSAR